MSKRGEGGWLTVVPQSIFEGEGEGGGKEEDAKKGFVDDDDEDDDDDKKYSLSLNSR